jgi:hypothetical protein
MSLMSAQHGLEVANFRLPSRLRHSRAAVVAAASHFDSPANQAPEGRQGQIGMLGVGLDK